MCCLKYEQDAYEDLLRNAPKAESFVDTPEGRGTVTEVDLLRQRVKVRLEDQPETIISVANEDIAILRSGKAKKNDPPIPADLAPISGSGKQVRKEREESPVFLDSIKFRYSEETIAETAQAEEEVLEETSGEPRRNSRRNRRNRNQHREHASRQNQAEASAPTAEPGQDGEQKPKKNHYHHRRNHHRRPKQGE
jgi:hypothetical protein